MHTTFTTANTTYNAVVMDKGQAVWNLQPSQVIYDINMFVAFGVEAAGFSNVDKTTPKRRTSGAAVLVSLWLEYPSVSNTPSALSSIPRPFLPPLPSTKLLKMEVTPSNFMEDLAFRYIAPAGRQVAVIITSPLNGTHRCYALHERAI